MPFMLQHSTAKKDSSLHGMLESNFLFIIDIFEIVLTKSNSAKLDEYLSLFQPDSVGMEEGASLAGIGVVDDVEVCRKSHKFSEK